MRRYAFATLAVAMAVSLSTVGIAAARRPATTSEKRAIAGADARCYNIYMSSSIPHVPRRIYHELTRAVCNGKWHG
jgi:hypothetical protein